MWSKSLNKIIFVVIICFITEFLQAQSSSRFPISAAATWNIEFLYYAYPDQHNQGDESYKYYIDKDTLINNHKYYKLYKSGVGYYGEPFYFNGIYCGALRDENNKFFFVLKNETSETMLFDFDLTPGDTIKASIGRGMTVNSIDTLPDGRKKISYGFEICAGCCPRMEIIEGIGHAGGIMEAAPCFHPGFQGHYLVCFSENKNIIYQNNYGFIDNPCDSNVPAELIKSNSKINIYPIPAKGSLRVESSSLLSNIISIELFNTQGIKILALDMKSQKISDKLELNISELKKGIYIIRINETDSFYVQKIIIE